MKTGLSLVASVFFTGVWTASAITFWNVHDGDVAFYANYTTQFPISSSGWGGDAAALPSSFWTGRIGFGSFPYSPLFPGLCDLSPYLTAAHSSNGSGPGPGVSNLYTDHMFRLDTSGTAPFVPVQYSQANTLGGMDSFLLEGNCVFDAVSSTMTITGDILLTRTGTGLPPFQTEVPDRSSSFWLTVMSLGAVVLFEGWIRKSCARHKTC
jgi:hypothetical protein